MAYMGTASQEGSFGIVWAASAHAGRQPDVRGLEVSSFAFMHTNQQRCERDRTIFVMGDSKFQATTVVLCDVKPTEAAKSLVTTQLELVDVWHGGVFACSKSAMGKHLGQRAAESCFV